MSYVLFIEFADDPPRVEVFDSLDEAEAILDAFEVTVFDPPLNDGLARIFECKGISLPFEYKSGDCSGWGAQVYPVPHAKAPPSDSKLTAR